MECICWKIKHSHQTRGDWKGARKVKMPYKEVQHKNPKEKTYLLELSTQLEDYTKAHNKAVHYQNQHKYNLSHSNASSFMKALTT